MNALMTALAQDAYDANAYRGVIGASKADREKAKAASAEAQAAVGDMAHALATLVTCDLSVLPGDVAQVCREALDRANKAGVS